MNEYTKIPSDKPVLLILIRPNFIYCTLLDPVTTKRLYRNCRKKVSENHTFWDLKNCVTGGKLSYHKC